MHPDNTSLPVLIVQAGRQLCALDARSVIEVLRPLPVQPVTGAPAFIVGLCRLRGRPTPVVDLATLLGHPAEDAPTRFVSLRLPERSAALAVTRVGGVRELPRAQIERLPALLAHTAGGDREGVAALGAELLWLLDAGRLLPDATWDVVPAEDAAP